MIHRALLPVLCFALISLPALAESGEHGEPHPHEIIADRATELGIDDITVGEILDLADSARDERDRLHEVVREEKQVLKGLLRQGEVDREAVMRQVEVLGEAEVAVRKHKLSVMIDMRSMLTDAQREALKSLMGDTQSRERRKTSVRRTRHHSSKE